MEVNFTQEKRYCPYKNEITGLIVKHNKTPFWMKSENIKVDAQFPIQNKD